MTNSETKCTLSACNLVRPTLFTLISQCGWNLCTKNSHANRLHFSLHYVILWPLSPRPLRSSVWQLAPPLASASNPPLIKQCIKQWSPTLIRPLLLHAGERLILNLIFCCWHVKRIIAGVQARPNKMFIQCEFSKNMSLLGGKMAFTFVLKS